MVPIPGGQARVPVPGTGTGTSGSTFEVPGTSPKYPVLSYWAEGTGTS